MEEKDNKHIITNEQMMKIKNKLEEIMNSDCIDPDDEDSTAPEETKSKPKPTVEQVVEILNSIKDNKGEKYEEDVTDMAEKFDDGKYWIWMRLSISPSKVEIITVWADEHIIVSEPIGRVVIEGVENVAKLIVALHVDIENVDDLMYNLFEALDNKIPGDWDADYYNPAEIIENLRKKYDIEYEVYPKPYIPRKKR